MKPFPTMTIGRGLRAPLLGLVVWALVGCLGIPERIEPGTPRAQIEERLGAPTAEYALAEGRRLQYSRQPGGQQVYNLDLDASGRLRQLEQVMDINWLQRNIAVDRWSRADVLRNLGRPALVERVASFRGDVWTYRFLEANSPRQVHLHIDPEGVVRRVMFTDEPTPDDPPDRS
ncbi:hypothetical protein [Hydrogenophaga sp.]|jgi:hypothetical protein|uniref:hypothetical protein n=1 Tax=Hydrogenophaga sp. TaxID=1904254 RepID=UPI003F72FB5A